MRFTFVHTADWQLGRTFKAFDPRVAGQLEEARFEAIDRIAAVARGAGAADVLVAGDAFDAPGLPVATLRRALERLAKHGATRWHLLPGNHDHARPAGLWQRLRGLAPPPNLVIHDSPRVVDIAPGIAVLPAPLVARAETADPTAWMDAAGTPPGTLRIGLAHGSIKDFGTAGESAVRIDPSRAQRAGLAYLALGDWHGTLKINDRTWYSGTPEPDRFPVNAPGQVLVVRLAAAAAPPEVETVATGRYVWAREEASVTALGDLDALERRLAERGVDFDRLVVRLALSGALPLADHAALGQWHARLEARVLVLDWSAEALAVTAGADDLAAFGDAGEVRAAADALIALAADAGDPRAPLARGALARLSVMHAALREGRP